MIERIHQKLGTAGFAVAIVALIAALSGTALAASGALTGKQKKEVEKIAKKYAGKPGATGPAGPAGAAGPKGDTGAKGDTGNQGNPGTPGAAGKSVVLAAEAKGANCAEGGTKVEVEGNAASKKYVCNGSPWTAGGTLPPGETETGVWSLVVSPTTEFVEAPVPISFPIPLSVGADKTFYFTPAQVEQEEFEGGCKWKLEEPAPKPESTVKGTLCVFAQEESPATIGRFVGFKAPGEEFGEGKYGPSGSFLYFEHKASGGPTSSVARGVWAVTAP